MTALQEILPGLPGDLPGPPRYGRRSVAEVLTSAAASLGVPGLPNALGLPAARRAVVVLVDGLGRAQLRARAGHAPTLSGARNLATLDAAFPTTTAASLASLGTGAAPGAHGLVGYDVLDPERDVVVNQLGGWDAAVDPRTWQPLPTVLERAAEHVDVVTVSRGRFAGSGLTGAALRGGRFVAADAPAARVGTALDQLAAGRDALMYFYWDELDRTGHAHGWESWEWTAQLEELDTALRRFAAQVPAGTTVLVTGDHGMVDVPRAGRVDVAEEPALLAGVRHTAGEPRAVQLHLEPDATADDVRALVTAWRDRFGSRVWMFSREAALAGGYFGPPELVRESVRDRIGDLLVAAKDPIALFDLGRQRPSVLSMVGQHGSLTRAEREVPLLRLG
ncbi:alkaline phosphatase family protein [Kocuria sp. M1R5S2]|uniref:alkaline phosphatase family protein n=1 Tax=Kocuria rhizosphaerae TaxID=3376285 RepID=UPI00378D1D7F